MLARAAARAADARGEAFGVDGFCLCCNRRRTFEADFLHSGVDPDGVRRPNWRERLVCPGCGMNNRQRLVAKRIRQAVREIGVRRLYIMEQVTPIHAWLRAELPEVEIEGSEYLGHDRRGGEVYGGLRHEDITALSFADGHFDLIVGNDVFEHVPDVDRAFAECCRVLAPGGRMLSTIPFHPGEAASRVRARIVDGAVVNDLEPQYHGNPVSEKGSLVFHDFGWDLVARLQRAGFEGAWCEVCFDERFGHIGDGLQRFWAARD
ncbi:MAG: hypothetical protein RJA99_3418 [Pseudomonadota bacterium]|jgi:SAM-dependent methyltransferase